jgi:hypothetical protein
MLYSVGVGWRNIHRQFQATQLGQVRLLVDTQEDLFHEFKFVLWRCIDFLHFSWLVTPNPSRTLLNRFRYILGRLKVFVHFDLSASRNWFPRASVPSP